MHVDYLALWFGVAVTKTSHMAASTRCFLYMGRMSVMGWVGGMGRGGFRECRSGQTANQQGLERAF